MGMSECFKILPQVLGRRCTKGIGGIGEGRKMESIKKEMMGAEPHLESVSDLGAEREDIEREEPPRKSTSLLHSAPSTNC